MMSELIFILVALLAAGTTFALVYRRTGGDCIP